MKDQAFIICGVTEKEYLDWCEKNNKKAYKQSTKADFFARIRSGRLARDSITGKLVVKRIKQ